MDDVSRDQAASDDDGLDDASDDDWDEPPNDQQDVHERSLDQRPAGRPRHPAGRPQRPCRKYFQRVGSKSTGKGGKWDMKCLRCPSSTSCILKTASAIRLKNHLLFECKGMSAHDRLTLQHEEHSYDAAHPKPIGSVTGRGNGSKRGIIQEVTAVQQGKRPRQQSISAFVDAGMTRGQQDALDDAIVMLITTAALPFALLKSTAFKELMNVARPCYKVPSTSHKDMCNCPNCLARLLCLHCVSAFHH